MGKDDSSRNEMMDEPGGLWQPDNGAFLNIVTGSPLLSVTRDPAHIHAWPLHSRWAGGGNQRGRHGFKSSFPRGTLLCALKGGPGL